MKMDYAIGIDLGGTFIKYALVDNKGKIIFESIKATQANSNRDTVVSNIKKCISETLDICNEKNIIIKGIGIGTPGIIDNGLVLGGAENLPEWQSFPLGGIISQDFNYPIFIDNDANLMGLAEVRFGSAKGTSDAIFLTIGTGVGGALVLNGKLYGGHRNRGAEIGHICLNAKGHECSCGTRGCLEAHASTTALIRDYRNLLLTKENKNTTDIDGKYIIEKYLAKEDVAIEAMNIHFDCLGTGIASLINIFSPQKVIIGGGISEAGDFYIENINKRALSIAMKETSVFTKIEKAKLGNSAGFLGAAALVFDKLTENKNHENGNILTN